MKASFAAGVCLALLAQLVAGHLQHGVHKAQEKAVEKATNHERHAKHNHHHRAGGAQHMKEYIVETERMLKRVLRGHSRELQAEERLLHKAWNKAEEQEEVEKLAKFTHSKSQKAVHQTAGKHEAKHAAHHEGLQHEREVSHKASHKKLAHKIVHHSTGGHHYAQEARREMKQHVRDIASLERELKHSEHSEEVSRDHRSAGKHHAKHESNYMEQLEAEAAEAAGAASSLERLGAKAHQERRHHSKEHRHHSKKAARNSGRSAHTAGSGMLGAIAKEEAHTATKDQHLSQLAGSLAGAAERALARDEPAAAEKVSELLHMVQQKQQGIARLEGTEAHRLVSEQQALEGEAAEAAAAASSLEHHRSHHQRQHHRSHHHGQHHRSHHQAVHHDRAHKHSRQGHRTAHGSSKRLLNELSLEAHEASHRAARGEKAVLDSKHVLQETKEARAAVRRQLGGTLAGAEVSELLREAQDAARGAVRASGKEEVQEEREVRSMKRLAEQLHGEK